MTSVGFRVDFGGVDEGGLSILQRYRRWGIFTAVTVWTGAEEL